MTRGWWGRLTKSAHETRGNGHESAEQPPERVPEPLRPPQGRVWWICSTPAGRKGCHHATEAEAEAHGEREGRCWWPVVVDEYEESA